MREDIKPFRVEWRLTTPMTSPDHPIHLDALLAWAAVDADDGDLSSQDKLPLKYHEDDDGRWVWMASQLFPDVQSREQLFRIRKFDTWTWGEDWNTKYVGAGKSHKPGTGPYKGYVFHTPMIHAPTVRAWGVGDIHAVRSMLDRVTNIGSLRRLDHGRIAEFSVTEDGAALALWGLRTRTEALEGYLPAIATVRPPYFQRHLREECYQPTALTIRSSLEQHAGTD